MLGSLRRLLAPPKPLGPLGRLRSLPGMARRRGLLDGLFGGRTGWLLVGAAALFASELRKGGREVRVTERLAPGQRLEITHLERATRRRR
jgi:hypothetical protein